jgi:hypothetical protein
VQKGNKYWLAGPQHPNFEHGPKNF